MGARGWVRHPTGGGGWPAACRVPQSHRQALRRLQGRGRVPRRHTERPVSVALARGGKDLPYLAGFVAKVAILWQNGAKRGKSRGSQRNVAPQESRPFSKPPFPGKTSRAGPSIGPPTRWRLTRSCEATPPVMAASLLCTDSRIIPDRPKGHARGDGCTRPPTQRSPLARPLPRTDRGVWTPPPHQFAAFCSVDGGRPPPKGGHPAKARATPAPPLRRSRGIPVPEVYAGPFPPSRGGGGGAALVPWPWRDLRGVPPLGPFDVRVGDAAGPAFPDPRQPAHGSPYPHPHPHPSCGAGT
mmetsp:Transcript_89347/g.154693  ORF Transcript_89347/g.154693 Transcript_89347/m.154693 type:complete len:298 (+) Transcript_89347:1418-2311(+)